MYTQEQYDDLVNIYYECGHEFPWHPDGALAYEWLDQEDIDEYRRVFYDSN